jgi:general secretion pathway protein L
MAIALDNTFRKIRWQFKHGQAGQFLRWWGEELNKAMPERFRERRQYAKRRLLVELGGGEIALSVDGGGSIQSLDAFSTGQDMNLLRQRVRELLQRHELTEVNRELLLDESAVLTSTVVMPLAAEINLRRALVYEMDRHTPFKAEQVFYNWRVMNRDREAGQLRFELFVTPREPVEEQLELLRQIGLSPAGVDIATAEGSMGVNLLPEEERFHIVNQQVRLNWMLAAGTVVILAFVMAQSLWLRQHQVEELNEAIDAVRSEALAVQQIRKQIDDATEAAGFLQGRKVENGYKSEVLAELTRILPDNTYLDRLSMHAETTQLQGKSDNAQSLIELVNESAYFENASFRGPTRFDSRTRKEIFDLTAANRPGGAE